MRVYAMCLPTFLHSMLRTCTFAPYLSNGFTIGLRTVTTCFILRMGCVCCRVLCYFPVVISSSGACSNVMVLVAYLSPKLRDFCLFLYHKWWDSIINLRVFTQNFLFFTLKTVVSLCKVSYFFFCTYLVKRPLLSDLPCGTHFYSFSRVYMDYMQLTDMINTLSLFVFKNSVNVNCAWQYTIWHFTTTGSTWDIYCNIRLFSMQFGRPCILSVFLLLRPDDGRKSGRNK